MESPSQHHNCGVSVAADFVSVLGYNLWSGALVGNFDINGLLDFFANQMLLRWVVYLLRYSRAGSYCRSWRNKN